MCYCHKSFQLAEIKSLKKQFLGGIIKVAGLGGTKVLDSVVALPPLQMQ